MTSPAPSPSSSTETWLVRVRGVVQGVGFRESCLRHAEALGVTGWVRNRRDGSVEAMLQGSADQLTRMREWLHRGPPAARVDEVEVAVQAPPSTRFDRFEFRRSE